MDGFDNYYTNRQTIMSSGPIRQSNGDSKHTSLSIHHKHVYLSGYNTNRYDFSKKTAQRGTVRLNFNESNPIPVTQLDPGKYTLSDHAFVSGDHIQKVSRFTVLDEKNDTLLGLFNINDQFSNITEKTYWGDIFRLNDASKTYQPNTHIQIGALVKYDLAAPSVGIQTMAIGKHIIVLGADNGDLILIK